MAALPSRTTLARSVAAVGLLLCASAATAGTAWPIVPLSWEGEGTVPGLLRLEAVFEPPDRVTLTQVITAGPSDGVLTLAVPDRSGRGGLEEIRLQANGTTIELERREADDTFRWRDVSADLLHAARLPMAGGEVAVLQAELRLRDTWVPYLEEDRTPAWYASAGPLFHPYWMATVDLRPAALWARTSGAEATVRFQQDPPPLPHTPILEPAGAWRREMRRAVYEVRGEEAWQALEIGLPAFETESLVPGDPEGVEAWLATEPSITPDALRVLAAAVEARSGRPSFETPRIAEFLQTRSWYRPAEDWGPDVPASRDRRAAALLRAAAGDGPPPPPLPGPEPRPETALAEARSGEEPAEPPAATPAPPSKPRVPPAASPSGPDLPATEEEARSWIAAARRSGATRRDVKLMKNSYFARHGYVFHTPWLQEEFESRSWYEPDPTAGTEELTDEERRIVALLSELEQEVPPEPAPTRGGEEAPPTAPARSASVGSPHAGGLPESFLDDADEIPRSRVEAEALVDRIQARGLGPKAARAARNAVYALHGRSFSTPWLRSFFESKSWYRADPAFQPGRLDAGEREAVQVLLAFERDGNPPPLGR